MRLRIQIVMLALGLFFTANMAYAFHSPESETVNQGAGYSPRIFGGNGGTTGSNGGTGGTGGTDGGTGGTGGSTGGNGVGCTRTQGYWGSSPAGQARLIQLVGMSGMMLGSVNYTAAQLDDILDQPSGGNALLILAKQLIAAKLNVLNGADDSEIDDEIDMADGLIGSRVIPPVGSDTVSPASALGQQMTQVAGVLDDFNNGQLNVPHCD